MTKEERINLLKKACEEALKRDPEVLEGKEIVYSKNSGKQWEEDNFLEFMNVPKNEVRICISSIANDMYRIIISKNMRWKLANEYITKRIKEKNADILVSSRSLDEDILRFTVTF